VKNVEKLVHALNNVWIDSCRVWASEARFDRFAHNDDVAASLVVREPMVKGQPVVMNTDEGVKKSEVGKHSVGGAR